MMNNFHDEVLNFISRAIENVASVIEKEPFLKTEDTIQEIKIKQLKHRMSMWAYIKSKLTEHTEETSKVDLAKMAMASCEFQAEINRLKRRVALLEKELRIAKGGSNGEDKIGVISSSEESQYI